MGSASSPESILAVDDAPDTLELIQRRLTASGYQVFTASGVEEAIRLLEETRVDLVITDLKMAKISGMDLVRHVRENLSDTEVMMITGYPTVAGAVTAVKAGAQEYLTKPFTNEELIAAVERVLDLLRARRAARMTPDDSSSSRCGLSGESKAMQKVFREITKAASSKATVLISGESGTGKELVARAIHYNSPRASAPFVAVNCGSVPENLLESELFGHVKGAFTGANEARAGFFQTADGGTVFLDEIGDTPLPMQAKLLRVLQEGELTMVGSDRARKVDVRVVAATHQDLEAAMARATFREDLYFRLNVITITVPPLRERGDDILLLASQFVSKFAKKLGQTAPRLADEVLRVLRRHPWPGNVRELENLMHRLVVMGDTDEIGLPELPSMMRFSVTSEPGLNRTLADVEVEHIRNVLASVGGNKVRAAEILGINRKTLRQKLKAADPSPD